MVYCAWSLVFHLSVRESKTSYLLTREQGLYFWFTIRNFVYVPQDFTHLFFDSFYSVFCYMVYFLSFFKSFRDAEDKQFEILKNPLLPTYLWLSVPKPRCLFWFLPTPFSTPYLYHSNCWQNIISKIFIRNYIYNNYLDSTKCILAVTYTSSPFYIIIFYLELLILFPPLKYRWYCTV